MQNELRTLDRAYEDLIEIISGLDQEMSWQPTGCRGWTVRDLVFHLLGDAQRALVALATPADRPADRDAITYWSDAPTGADPESREIRAVRTMASAWRLEFLTATYAETARAVVTQAGRTPSPDLVATQGHVLRADDLLTTLTVEATVHHLDLVVALDRPGPAAEPLLAVRQTLDGLLGRPVPIDWDDETYARAGTGRRALTAPERITLGPDAHRLPLLS